MSILESILERYSDYIWSIIKCQTNNTHDGEEYYQCAVLEIMRALKSGFFPETSNPAIIKSYLYRTIVNNAIDKSRRKICEYKSNKAYSDIRYSYETKYIPDRGVIEEEEIDLIENDMDKLPKRLRYALKSKYFLSEDIHTIASKMGVSSRTISKYISIGIRELRIINKNS